MSEQTDSLMNQIQTWVVNDYFTPNIKAEVILDTLLTPYVDKLVNQQLGLHATFVTKEMSIYEEPVDENNQTNNRGAKIDYVLADHDTVYLVELKTTNGSIKAEQAERYITHCYGKTFGEALGDKLLRIMATSAQKAKIGKLSQQKEGALYEAFQQITGEGPGSYADRARRFLKQRLGAGTDKYLYTMGQLLDYLYDEKSEQLKALLWDKKLRLIYLTPDGCEIIPKKKEFYQNNQQAWDAFYLNPLQPAKRGSVSLCASASWLREAHGGDAYALFLAETIEAIYLPEKEA